MSVALPLSLSFHNIEASDALRALVEERSQHLHEVAPELQNLRVVIDEQHRSHLHGNHFQVHLELSLPGQRLAVSHDGPSRSHENAYAVVREAFANATRRVRKTLDRRHAHRARA